MSWPDLVASLVSSLAWPLVVLAAVLLLRRQLSAFLAATGDRLLRRFKAGPVEMEWDDDLRIAAKEADITSNEGDGDASDTKLVKLARIDPHGAILTAFRDVDQALNDLLADIPPGQKPWKELPTGVKVENAIRLRVIDEELLHAVNSLRRLRNEVAHQAAPEVTQDRAIRYVSVAEGLARALRHAKGSA